MKFGTGIIALSALCCGLASPASAAPSSSIKLDITAYKEITLKDEKGVPKVQRVEPKLVLPGEEIIYDITYSNIGKEPTTTVVVTNRIPEHMTYVQKSAGGAAANVLFSVDGTTFAPPERLSVHTPDGQSRPATEKDFTHIRWVMNAAVSPGSRGVVSYRARLD